MWFMKLLPCEQNIIKIYTNVNTNKCNEIVNNNENSDM